MQPLFFTLSGLTLAIVYNDVNPTDEEVHAKPLIASSPKTSTLGFYRNRVVRTMPMYYLMNFVFALPLWLFGLGSFAWGSSAALASIGSTAMFSSTMFIFCLGAPLNGPAWTVQTLMWIWLFFPRWINQARRMLPIQLGRWIFYLNVIQATLVIVIFFALFARMGFWPAFCAATMNPISRFPLFLMGLYAGELLSRASKDSTFNLSAVWPKSYGGQPYPCALNSCEERVAPAKGSRSMHRKVTAPSADGTVPPPVGPTFGRQYWTKKANMLSGYLCAVTLSVAILDRFYRTYTGGASILGMVWLQALVPFAQLELLVALSLMSRSTQLFRALTTKAAKFLGSISMTIYLTHFPVIYYVVLAANNFQSLPWSTADDQTAGLSTDRLLPLWGIPIVPIITLPLATLIFYGFEEPVRRFFKR